MKYLAFLSIIGLPVYVIQYFEKIESRSIEFYRDLGYHKDILIIAINAAYTIIVLLWSFVFVTKWSVHENILAYQWGQLDYEESENKIHGYYGIQRRSPVNDDVNEIYYPSWKRSFKVVFSLLISVIIIACLAAVVVALLYFRNWIIESKWGGSLNDYLIYIPSKIFVLNLIGILNTVQILIFTLIYKSASLSLTVFENQETLTKYEDSLIIKTL